MCCVCDRSMDRGCMCERGVSSIRCEMERIKSMANQFSLRRTTCLLIESASSITARQHDDRPHDKAKQPAPSEDVFLPHTTRRRRTPTAIGRRANASKALPFDCFLDVPAAKRTHRQEAASSWRCVALSGPCSWRLDGHKRKASASHVCILTPIPPSPHRHGQARASRSTRKARSSGGTLPQQQQQT